jgi:capsular polysaccharide biosynthesis protein
MHLSDNQPLKDSRDLSLAGPTSVPALQTHAIPPPTKSDIDILDCLSRRWVLAAAIFLFCAAVGYRLVRHYVRPMYQAETTVYVSPSALKDYAEHANELSYVTLVNQQVLTVLHYDTLSSALRRLDASGHPFRERGETEQAAIDRLRQWIGVWRVPDSYEIAIAATGHDPTHLAFMANAVADAFLEQGRGGFVSERSSHMAVLTAEKNSVDKQLAEKLETVAEYSGKLQVVDLERAATFPDDAVLAQMRVALAGARQKRIEAEQQLAVAEPSGAAAAAEQIFMSDATTKARIDTLLQRQTDLRSRLDGMLPANPLYKSAQKELATVNAQLHSIPSDMIRTIGSELVDKLHADVEETQRTEQALANQVNQDAVNLEQTSRELHDARALNADIERLRTHRRDIQERIDALNLQADLPGFLSVFSLAQRPLQPLKNQKTKALGALLGLALALSLCIPIGLDLLDPRIHSPAGVERVVGFLPMGMTMATKDGEEDFADEHLHRVATGIQRCIARGAKTVLLSPLKMGVPDALADEIARLLIERGFKPAVIHANRPGIVTGRKPVTALGRYGSLLNGSVQDCDVVLISAQPLLLSADSELLAIESDVTLVVVEAGKSKRKDLERAARLLERLRVAGVGAILTSVRVERAGRVVRSDFRDYVKLLRLSGGLETSVKN